MTWTESTAQHLRLAILKFRRRSAMAVLRFLFLWGWLRLGWRSLSSWLSYDEVRLGGMWPTHIIGAACPLCDAPLVMAWREVAGTTHPWRINVEWIVSCGCDGEDMVAALQEEIE